MIFCGIIFLPQKNSALWVRVDRLVNARTLRAKKPQFVYWIIWNVHQLRSPWCGMRTWWFPPYEAVNLTHTSGCHTLSIPFRLPLNYELNSVPLTLLCHTVNLAWGAFNFSTLFQSGFTMKCKTYCVALFECWTLPFSNLSPQHSLEWTWMH